MILVTKSARRQSLKPDVVFDVGSRQHHCRRLCKLEQHSLKRSESRLVQVFDDFNHCRGIESAEPLVAIRQ